ncbi:MAG TPA: glycosyltransferase family 39 protein, partial [Planctomycetota bacterium]|nr:glycosyltransferase family 39 protein [Planctomycetota bacterium]
MERDEARCTDPFGREGCPRLGLSLMLAVALLARLAVVLSDPYGIAGPDAGEWASTAEHIRSEGEFPRHRGSPTLPYPLYPLLLAGTLSLGHDTGILVAKLLNVAAGVLAAFLACRIAGRFASARVATFAGWAVALHPALVHYAGALSTDSIFVPLLLGVLLGAARLLERPTAGRGAALGVLMALAALQRPSSAAASAVIAVVVAVALLVRAFSNWRALLAATAAAVLVLAPWGTYLTVRFGEPILLSDAWGYAYWDGHHPINARVDDVEDPAERGRLSAEKHEEMRRIGASARARGLSPIETARTYRAAAEEHIAAGRVSRAGATASNLTHLLAFWPN